MSEGVIKSGHREPFTVLYKSAIRDTRLSFEMLGFLTYMLDKPPDWEFTISGMAKERGVGLAQVRRLVGLLEKAGYLLREQAHDDGGKFAKNVYVLQEKPPLSRNQYDGEPLKSPLSGNADIGETRQRENPLSVFATQSKNVKTKAYIIPPIVPHDVADVLLDYCGEDEQLLFALCGLLENRAKVDRRKTVVTTRAMNGILGRLDRLSKGDRAMKLAMLEKTIMSNWLTVYELKPDDLPRASGGGWEDAPACDEVKLGVY